jgi:hypothetical protein
MADIQTIGLNDDTYRGFRLGQSRIRFNRVHRALPARFLSMVPRVVSRQLEAAEAPIFARHRTCKRIIGDFCARAEVQAAPDYAGIFYRLTRREIGLLTTASSHHKQ